MTTIHGLGEMDRQVLAKGLCASCGACVGLCPYLVRFKGRTVKLDACTVERGRCYAFCPMTFFDAETVSRAVFGAPPDTGEIGRFIEVLAARSSDPETVARAQGGGTVTALTAMALEEGIIDAAVLTGGHGDDGFPEGTVALTRQNVEACTGSRFVGAHSLTALREALNAGYDRIGVVGLPCQVRALRKMGLHDLKSENLGNRIALVIGLFCNWSFSARDFKAFLPEKDEGKRVKKWDIPPPPANVLNLITEQGTESIPLDEVRHLIQGACKACPDMTSEFADVSVGMFEGRPGWNTLVVRTAQGRTLVETAVEKGAIETEPFPDANLEHLKRASASKRKRASDSSISGS